jgi:hypothetical protein
VQALLADVEQTGSSLALAFPAPAAGNGDRSDSGGGVDGGSGSGSGGGNSGGGGGDSGSGGDSGGDSSDGDPVTVAIVNHVKWERVEEHAEWLTTAVSLMSTFEGFISCRVIEPDDCGGLAGAGGDGWGDGEYTVVYRFTTLELLKRWLTSEAREDCMLALLPLIHVSSASGGGGGGGDGGGRVTRDPGSASCEGILLLPAAAQDILR